MVPNTPKPDKTYGCIYNDKTQNVNIKLGIKYDVEINGDSIFRCVFEIDWTYYEEQTGDEGPESFLFIYDFKNGIIIGYETDNAQLDCVRVPHPEHETTAGWSLGQGGDWMDEDIIRCLGDSLGEDIEGERQDEMWEVVKTIDGVAFKKLAEKALNKIKEYEGIA